MVTLALFFQAFHDDAGNLRPEIIEHQLAMSTEGPGDLLHGDDAGARPRFECGHRGLAYGHPPIQHRPASITAGRGGRGPFQKVKAGG